MDKKLSHVIELQNKIDVTYEEAERALNKYHQNIDEAYIYLTTQKNNKKIQFWYTVQNKLAYKCDIKFKGKVAFTVPYILVLGIIPLMQFKLIALCMFLFCLMIIFMDSEIIIYNAKCHQTNVQSTDLSNAKNSSNVAKSLNNGLNVKACDNGFYEIVVD